jgi:hypothetical protein
MTDEQLEDRIYELKCVIGELRWECERLEDKITSPFLIRIA